MNPESYISSGILELFVAGSLPEAEAMEVVEMAQKYPEIQAEIEAIEQAVGELATQWTPDVLSPDILTGALAQIEEEEKKSNAPVVPLTPSEDTGKPVEAPVKQISPIWRWVAGILFLGSMAANGFLYQRWQSASQEVNVLRVQNEELETEFRESSSVLAFYQNPQNRPVPLNGLDIAPESQLMVYWNAEASTVHLQVQSLPTPGENEQYQLWAIQGETPVDAGVFDLQFDLQAVKSISGSVDAFAVTLEPKGGSVSPTLEKMYAIGNVSG